MLARIKRLNLLFSFQGKNNGILKSFASTTILIRLHFIGTYFSLLSIYHLFYYSILMNLSLSALLSLYLPLLLSPFPSLPLSIFFLSSFLLSIYDYTQFLLISLSASLSSFLSLSLHLTLFSFFLYHTFSAIPYSPSVLLPLFIIL